MSRTFKLSKLQFDVTIIRRGILVKKKGEEFFKSKFYSNNKEITKK